MKLKALMGGLSLNELDGFEEELEEELETEIDELLQKGEIKPTGVKEESDSKQAESKEDEIEKNVVKPRIKGVMSRMNLAVEQIDLLSLTQKMRNTEYNPKRYPGLILRSRQPRSVASIFASGKVTLQTRTTGEAKQAARKVAKLVQKITGNDSVRCSDFEITNILGSGSVPFRVRLENLASEHHKYASYEPDLFPGLVYRVESPKCVLLVFASGRVVLTGARTEDALMKGFDLLYPVLCKHRRA
mmetsp:Transcript_40613/g.65296  ORF Transcript_40613/g.65296 Transcript_40613/m.65296 type:complete len:245 (+) Transcript_40613:55-789(+)